MNAVVWNVRKIDFTRVIDCWSFRELVASAHKLPVFIFDHQIHATFFGFAYLERFRIAAPDPAQGIRHDGGAVFSVVATFAPDVIHVVARVLQSRQHRLIRVPPASGVNILVAASVLKKDTQWFIFRLADQARKRIRPTQRYECTDRTDDSAKRIRTFPCGIERTDAARTGTGETTIVRVVAEFPCPPDFRQKLVNQESRVAVAEAIVFEAAVETWLRIFIRSRNAAVSDKDSQLYGNLPGMNHIVQHDWQPPVFRHAKTVLNDHQTRRFLGIVLGWDVDPVFADRANENGTAKFKWTFDFSLRHAVLYFAFGRHRIFLFHPACRWNSQKRSWQQSKEQKQ